MHSYGRSEPRASGSCLAQRIDDRSGRATVMCLELMEYEISACILIDFPPETCFVLATSGKCHSLLVSTKSPHARCQRLQQSSSKPKASNVIDNNQQRGGTHLVLAAARISRYQTPAGLSPCLQTPAANFRRLMVLRRSRSSFAYRPRPPIPTPSTSTQLLLGLSALLRCASCVHPRACEQTHPSNPSLLACY
jgi:hypothetical protein